VCAARRVSADVGDLVMQLLTRYTGSDLCGCCSHKAAYLVLPLGGQHLTIDAADVDASVQATPGVCQWFDRGQTGQIAWGVGVGSPVRNQRSQQNLSPHCLHNPPCTPYHKAECMLLPAPTWLPGACCMKNRAQVPSCFSPCALPAAPLPCSPAHTHAGPQAVTFQT
jgi:hypothetical protein